MRVLVILDIFLVIEANKHATVNISIISVSNPPLKVRRILLTSEKLKQRLKEKYVATNNKRKVVKIIAIDKVNIFISAVPSKNIENTTPRLKASKDEKSFLRSIFSIRL